ncbi:MAG: sulfotransferase [Pseudomonadota bacterium]
MNTGSSDFASLYAPKDGYVFVVTYGRSGSTLLQHLLNRIPGYCIRGENGDALRPLFMSWKRLRKSPGPRPRAAPAGKGATAVPTHPFYGMEHIDPYRYRLDLADTFVRQVLRLPAGTRVGGFKEIRYMAEPRSLASYLDFIATTFPQTRFVFNTRDHEAVCQSGWWKSQPRDEVLKMLARGEAEFDRYIASKPDRCLKLHYDTYVADHAEFARLFEFLGETTDLDLVADVMGRQLTHLKTTAG